MPDFRRLSALLPLPAMLLLLSPPFLSQPSLAAPQGEDPGPIIDQVMKAYGGKEALAKVQAYAFAGSLEDRVAIHSDDPPRMVPFSRTFQLPGRLKVSI